jgi:predicted NAD/FAD-binding protein
MKSNRAVSQKIAIIGGGISGLTAGYLLHSCHDICLFEKEGRLGGNACTHQTKDGEILDIAVGSVLRRVARNFLALCRAADVEMVPQPTASLISFHDPSVNDGMYPTFFSLKGLIDQKFGLVRKAPVLIKVLSMMKTSVKMLDHGGLKGLTVGELFALFPGMTPYGRHVVMAPFCTLSCMTYDEVMAGPAEYFVEKMKAHGNYNPVVAMIENVFPKHYTKSYVEAFSAGYKDKVVLNADIRTVRRTHVDITVFMTDGAEYRFDKVIFACNPDQALELIENPTDQERYLLGSWTYKDVKTVVHRDNSSAPKRSLCQPWTCILAPKSGNPHFSISYCNWLLNPSVSRDSPYYSTLHPNFIIQEDVIDTEKRLRVPLYDFKALSTQKDLPLLNGRMNSYFCGSYFGRGLHGDAVDSAVRVANLLGVKWGGAA